MRAAQYSRYDAGIDIVELPEPSAPADGILVRVEATGVCRSDWHAWKGHDDDVSLPHVPGHEFAGTVVGTGETVSTLHTGMRVVVPFILGCGRCEVCRRGDAQLCPQQLQPGFHLPGSFAELVAVPRADFNVVPLPPEVSSATAAALGCRYTTAWRALVQQGDVRESHRAVHGSPSSLDHPRRVRLSLTAACTQVPDAFCCAPLTRTTSPGPAPIHSAPRR